MSNFSYTSCINFERCTKLNKLDERVIPFILRLNLYLKVNVKVIKLIKYQLLSKLSYTKYGINQVWYLF